MCVFKMHVSVVNVSQMSNAGLLCLKTRKLSFKCAFQLRLRVCNRDLLSGTAYTFGK